MYLVKTPSYTKNYKMYGHLFQIYNVIDTKTYPVGNIIRGVLVDSYVDYEKKEKLYKKEETFRGHIKRNPSIDHIKIGSWDGSSPVAVFDKLEDALVYKALANQKAKVQIAEKLDALKLSIEKQFKKINISNQGIINEYPEYFL